MHCFKLTTIIQNSLLLAPMFLPTGVTKAINSYVNIIIF